MTENAEQNRDILLYVRERDEAKEEVKKLASELSATKSKLYDATCKIDELKAQIKQLETKTPAATNAKGGKKAPAKQQNSTAKGGTKGKLAPPPAANRSVSPSPSAASSTSVSSPYHPPIFGKESLSQDSKKYYWEIAQRYPDLKMVVVLDAEKKFKDADSNGDGVIDKEELDRLLASDMSFGMFTPKQVEEIIKEIDQDDNNTLDFVEVLAILEKLSKRRSKLSTLPASIQDNQTKICSIQ